MAEVVAILSTGHPPAPTCVLSNARHAAPTLAQTNFCESGSLWSGCRQKPTGAARRAATTALPGSASYFVIVNESLHIPRYRRSIRLDLKKRYNECVPGISGTA